jgi:hypothetical protein
MLQQERRPDSIAPGEWIYCQRPGDRNRPEFPSPRFTWFKSHQNRGFGFPHLAIHGEHEAIAHSACTRIRIALEADILAHVPIEAFF